MESRSSFYEGCGSKEICDREFNRSLMHFAIALVGIFLGAVLFGLKNRIVFGVIAFASFFCPFVFFWIADIVIRKGSIRPK